MCIVSLMNLERDDSMERSTRIKADKEVATKNVRKKDGLQIYLCCHIFSKLYVRFIHGLNQMSKFAEATNHGFPNPLHRK